MYIVCDKLFFLFVEFVHFVLTMCLCCIVFVQFAWSPRHVSLVSMDGECVSVCACMRACVRPCSVYALVVSLLPETSVSLLLCTNTHSWVSQRWYCSPNVAWMCLHTCLHHVFPMCMPLYCAWLGRVFIWEVTV